MEDQLRATPTSARSWTRVRELLKKGHLNATVEVAYFLVCPDDGSKHKWLIPTEQWAKGVKSEAHRRDIFCIRVPVPVRRVYPLLRRRLRLGRLMGSRRRRPAEER